MKRFLDKVVLITGGGGGIGQATAIAFAREGATVVVAGRSLDRLTETVKLIEGNEGKASAVEADVSKPADAERMVQETVRRHGGLHIAFNNAGVFGPPAPLVDLDPSVWAETLNINLTGLWLSLKYEVAHMKTAGGGVIVNMSSSVGPHLTVPGLGAYAASKAAVSSLTRTAAKEYIRDGIRINAISPGPCDTPMSMFPGETEADRAERMRHQVPIGRVGSLDEVTGTVLWLASPASGFAVGHDLVIDGGSVA